MKMKSPNFVTNFNPAEIDVNMWLRVAEQLGLRAWVASAVEPLHDGMMGFYVDRRVADLSQFWEIVEFNEN